MSDNQVDARVDRVVANLQAKGIKIRRANNHCVVQTLEQDMDGTCPAFFRSLVSRYSYPQLEIGPLLMFANQGGRSSNDISVAPFRDPILAQWMKTNRVLQIGRAVSRFYDPICLPLRASNSPSTKDPLCQFNHEAILQEEAEISPVETWNSWIELLEWSECSVVDSELDDSPE